MRLYLVHVTKPDVKKFAWVGSQAEAAAARASFTSDGHKRADIETKEVDVPTDKKGLIEFLNRGQFD